MPVFTFSFRDVATLCISFPRSFFTCHRVFLIRVKFTRGLMKCTFTRADSDQRSGLTSRAAYKVPAFALEPHLSYRLSQRSTSGQISTDFHKLKLSDQQTAAPSQLCSCHVDAIQYTNKYLFIYFLARGSMESFPSVGDLSPVLNLSRLQLADLNLEHLTEPQRKQIQQLHLTYNSLSLFPTSLCMFSNLEFLDMSNNALTAFPEDILQLTHLKTLVAKNNQLDEASFPKRLGSMPIEILNFSGNRFREIPNQFLELSRLQSLSMGGNRLKSIPAEIENLTRQVIFYHTSVSSLRKRKEQIKLGQGLIYFLVHLNTHEYTILY